MKYTKENVVGVYFKSDEIIYHTVQGIEQDFIGMCRNGEHIPFSKNYDRKENIANAFNDGTWKVIRREANYEIY